MSNDVWRWADPDGQQRRVRLDELRAALAGGHIAPNTPVWKPGWAAWQAAQEVPELTSASVGGANGVVLNIPPPPLAMVAVQQDYEKKSESMAPAPMSVPPASPEPEPPPPPRYVPLATKMPSMHPASSSQNIATQVGGTPALFATSSASVPIAPPMPMVQSIPTTIGMPAPNLAPPGVSVEELSNSLLESGSLPDLPQHGQNFGAPPSARQSDGGMPRPSDPLLHGGPLFLHDPPIRQPGVLDHLVGDIKGLTKGQPPKNKPVLIAAGVLSLLMVTGLLVIIVSVASGGSASAKTIGSASASALASAKPPPVLSAPTAVALSVSAPPVVASPPVKSIVLGDCTVVGDPKVIAPRATSSAAIEGQALGANLALGFAPGVHDAVATMLDPTSLAPTATVRSKPAGGDVRRVTPILNNGKLSLLADVEKKSDRLASRRSVSTSPLLDVGVAENQVVWAPHGKDSFAKLFALDGAEPVEALRAIPLADRRGVAVTFRRDNAIRIGVARGEGVLEADGELSKIDGLAQEKGTLGSPSITATGDRVVVAWADRASTSDDWGIRWTTVKAHGSTKEATPFVVPTGGLGANAMSPSVASLGGGRFLLAWTEGPTSGHQVRAMAFGADGSPSGSALAISAPSDNAGQPAVAINEEGRGVVAFLSAKGKNGFEVHVTAISCPRQP